MWHGCLLTEGQDTCYSDVTATHETLKQLTEEVKENGCKLCMDNLFLSRDVFSDLTEKKFNCCGALWPNKKECHRPPFDGCFLLVSRLTYTWILETVAVCSRLGCTSTRLHGVIYQDTVLLIGSACRLFPAGFLFVLHLDPEDGGSIFL
jgi:hypothetical protein